MKSLFVEWRQISVVGDTVTKTVSSILKIWEGSLWSR